jgi:hypothetical protein
MLRAQQHQQQQQHKADAASQPPRVLPSDPFGWEAELVPPPVQRSLLEEAGDTQVGLQANASRHQQANTHQPANTKQSCLLPHRAHTLGSTCGLPAPARSTPGFVTKPGGYHATWVILLVSTQCLLGRGRH